jgi:outer membrane protein OmpA-like peptidoglycan-associated protein
VKSLLVVLSLLLATPALASVFIAQDREVLDPEQGEKPEISLTFQATLHRATITVTADDGSFNKTWNHKAVNPGKVVKLSWPLAKGEMGYTVFVEMVSPTGEKYTEETWVSFIASPPLRVEIPRSSVDVATRSFDLVTNHPPVKVELEVLDVRQQELGKSTFKVSGAVQGKPVRVTWEQQKDGDLVMIRATAYDEFGKWAGADIIKFAVPVKHEDVEFGSGSSDIVPSETHKVDSAWSAIDRTIKQYGEWVECSLFVGGHTDTVGDAGSNLGLSERRAMAIAKYFRAKGAAYPIFYRGYGESSLAVPTADAVDEPRNRRAEYTVTDGTAPGNSGGWKRVP